jgi:hypothetical protein
MIHDDLLHHRSQDRLKGGNMEAKEQVESHGTLVSEVKNVV